MADKVVQVFDLIKEMTVLELNNLRKKIEEEFDVKAVAPVAVAGAAADAGAAAAVEEATVSVFIKEPGAKKVEVIKVIRAATGLALKEAKELAESAGASPVKENLEKPEAEKFAEELRAAGATVEVR